MKKVFLLLLMTLITSAAISSQEKLTINTKKSTIKWIGELVFYFRGHDGYINFKEGFFIKNGDAITGGEFIIDMDSMTNSDIKEQEGKDMLIKHLKDSDFFDVSKYPLAKLVFTKVEYSNANNAHIKANLTLKGITKPIHFDVKFDYVKKEMSSRFKINRRDWNVNYTNKMKDGAVSDAIGFEVLVKL